MTKSSETEENELDLGSLLSFQIYQLNMKLSAQARGIIARYSSLTLPQWRIIRLLGMQSGSTSTAVRKIIGADKSQFSKSLSLLMDKGFIVSSPNPNDKRQSLLQLTALGQEAHDKILPYLRMRNEFLLDQLTPEQRDMIFDVIEILSNASDRTDFVLEGDGPEGE